MTIKAGVVAKIQEVDSGAIDQLDTRAFALRGATFMTSASNWGAGAGISPVSRYTGFVVMEAGATVSAINFGIYKGLYGFAPAQSIVDFTFTTGQFYPIMFESITISAGALMLIPE